SLREAVRHAGALRSPGRRRARNLRLSYSRVLARHRQGRRFSAGQSRLPRDSPDPVVRPGVAAQFTAMIDDRRVLALIPARGGSTGVPRKNLRLVAGRPLLAWTIAAARTSNHIDRLILSSDDDEIAEVAR